MGLFDFFTKKEKAAPVKQQESDGSIQFETRFYASDITKEPQRIDDIVAKIVADDPFQNYYQGKGSTIFEYNELSTMNVDLDENLNLSIEGLPLGPLPQQKVQEIKAYHDKYMLTIYAFVTGGHYKRYDGTETTEGFSPYNLTIHLQYT